MLQCITRIHKKERGSLPRAPNLLAPALGAARFALCPVLHDYAHSHCISKSRILALLGRKTASDWILCGVNQRVSNYGAFHILARPGPATVRMAQSALYRLRKIVPFSWESCWLKATERWCLPWRKSSPQKQALPLVVNEGSVRQEEELAPAPRAPTPPPLHYPHRLPREVRPPPGFSTSPPGSIAPAPVSAPAPSP